MRLFMCFYFSNWKFWKKLFLCLKFKLRGVFKVKYVIQNLFQLKTHFLCNNINNGSHVSRTTVHWPSLSWINWSAVFRRLCYMSDVDCVISCLKFELYFKHENVMQFIILSNKIAVCIFLELTDNFPSSYV